MFDPNIEQALHLAGRMNALDHSEILILDEPISPEVMSYAEAQFHRPTSKAWKMDYELFPKVPWWKILFTYRSPMITRITRYR